MPGGRKHTYTIEAFIQAVKSNVSKAGVLRSLGLGTRNPCNYKTFTKLVELHDIDCSHLLGRAASKGTQRPKKKLSEMIGATSHRLRLKLIEEGVKEHQCEICLNTTWNGISIALELHHIDGNKENNDLSNLQILCPNCHAQTPNYRGRAKKTS